MQQNRVGVLGPVECGPNSLMLIESMPPGTERALLCLRLGSGMRGIGAAMEKHEINKRVVLDFYDAVVNRRDFEAAAMHLGTKYIQHRADC
jgi:hypothetical protein